MTDIEKLLELAQKIDPKDVKAYITKRDKSLPFQDKAPDTREWLEWKVLEAVRDLAVIPGLGVRR